MKMVVGLTGPTGAGKSTVSKVAADMGVQVIDCDKAARAAVKPGMPGLNAVVSVFGDKILNADGTLNRKALAAAAFCDKEHTDLLNRTLLPHIGTLINEMMTGDKILLDAPTLFESGIDKRCIKTVAVLANVKTRLKRIIARDGIDEAAALLRINAGKPDSFYIERADYIIENDTDIQTAEEKAAVILKEIFERK